jgi:hypothetical protein
MYPNVVSTADKVMYMNMAQDEISPYMGLIVEDTTLATIDGTDAYAYPTGLTDISQILSLAIANTYKNYVALTAYVVGDTVMYQGRAYDCILDSTGNLPTNATYWSVIGSARYNFYKYKQNYSETNPDSDFGYYQIYSSTGGKKLCITPIPDATGYQILIRYRKKLTDLSASSMSAEPDFDSRWHDMLAFYACHMICTIGSSPDSIQADMFMRKFDDSLKSLWKFKNTSDNKTKSIRRDNTQWHKCRSHGSGF